MLDIFVVLSRNKFDMHTSVVCERACGSAICSKERDIAALPQRYITPCVMRYVLPSAKRGRGNMTYITLTVNPSIDVTYPDSPPIVAGGTNRVGSRIVSAGGKGINLSRALFALGERRVETLFFANKSSKTGSLLCSMLDAPMGEETDNPEISEEITEASEASEESKASKPSEAEETRKKSELCLPYTPIPYADPEKQTRICIKISSEDGSLTEINETGESITREDMMSLVSYLAELIATDGQKIFMLCGSIPQTVEIPVYNLLIKLMKSCGITCVLDSSGRGLSEGIKEQPSLIKPNLEELCALAGRKLDFDGSAVEYSKQLFHSYGCEVLLTNGGKGAYYVGSRGVIKATPPEICHSLSTGTVGCGDLFLACFVRAYYGQGRSAVEALRLATGYAAYMADSYPDTDLSRLIDGQRLEQMNKLAHGVRIEEK